MPRARQLFRTVRHCCLVALATILTLPADLQAATSRQASGSPRPSEDKRPLTLAQAGAAAQQSAEQKRRAAAAAARRRAAARARAAAQAKALKEAQEPRFKLDETGALVPDIRAEAAIVYNPETGEVLYESNARDQRSIASITKVMTAVVVVESEADLSEVVTVSASDVARASTTYLRAGDKVTREDLLHLMLIASDNAAARALARTSPYGSTGFIEQMDAKAQELGLTDTRYADPSGLLAANVSSAYEMAQLIAYASGDEVLSAIMRKQSHQVTAGRRVITIHSTNQLVRQGDVEVEAGKTGFIRRAGYCLATLLRLPQTGSPVAVVVLGATSNAGRFWETRHLFNWLAAKASTLFETPLSAAN